MKFYTTIQPGDNDFNATLFEWEGSQPGLDIIYEENAIAVEEDWVEVDIAAQNITFDGDFVVGFGSVNATTFIGYDTDLNNGRSWDYDNASPSWASWNEAYLIRAIVEYPDGTVAEVAPVAVSSQPTIKSMVNSAHPTDYTGVTVVKPIDNQAGQIRGLLGFNVYRDDNMINSELVTETTYVDEDLSASTYVYYVKAVYDEGESGPSNSVTVVITGINELERTVSIYPNPANNVVNINSDTQLKTVRIVNYTGQVVYTENVSGNTLSINTSDLATGIYVLQFESESGWTSQKLIIE
jgi:hypothetical protein